VRVELEGVIAVPPDLALANPLQAPAHLNLTLEEHIS
jgi:hypothetical protein